MKKEQEPKIFQPGVRLKKIKIKNFRGIEWLDVDFDSKLNIIIGDNGSGKTTILDGIVLTLNGFMQKLLRQKSTLKKMYNDFNIKFDCLQAVLSTHFQFGDNNVDFDVIFNKNKSLKVTSTDLNPIIERLDEIKSGQKPINLPLFVYYPMVNAPPGLIDFKENGKDVSTDIFKVYDNIIGKMTFDFNSFFSWYKWQENIEKQVGENRILRTVRTAIYSILSDDTNKFEKLWINWLNKPAGEMLIHKNDIPLNINQLSSGEKILLILVADLVRLLTVSNPHRENPLEGHGIILIDEIDLHLHPKWQRVVVPQLQKTFPNCQFVITTHSPLLLSKANRENVILLKNFQILASNPYTYGRDTNSILYELMGVEQRPIEMQKRIDKVYELIDEKKIDEAKELLKTLSKDLGENDIEIVRAYTHLNFMED